MTGADLPVMAASLTEAMPSITSPSDGIRSPASTRTMSSDLQLGRGHQPVVLQIVPGQHLGLGLGALAAERLGLRLAAAFCDRRRKVGEQHREPQPEDDLKLEADTLAPPVIRSRIRITVVRAVTTSSTNITGFFISVRGLSLTKAEPIAGTTIFGSKSADTGLLWRSVDDSMVIGPN